MRVFVVSVFVFAYISAIHCLEVAVNDRQDDYSKPVVSRNPQV